jgi:hypothetical protein
VEGHRSEEARMWWWRIQVSLRTRYCLTNIKFRWKICTMASTHNSSWRRLFFALHAMGSSS